MQSHSYHVETSTLSDLVRFPSRLLWESEVLSEVRLQT